MGFIDTGDLITSVLYNYMYLLGAGFLCLFAVKERLKHGLAVAMLPVVVAGLAIEFIGVWFPGVVYAALVLAFLYCHFTIKMDPAKLLYIILMIANLMWLISAILQVIGADHAFFLLFLPPAAFVMRKLVWPALKELDKSEIWVLLPLTAILLSIAMFFSSDAFVSFISRGWQYAAIIIMLTAATLAAYFLMLVMLRKALESARAREQLRFIEAQLATQSERYEEIASHTREIKTLRHDMRHHLMTLDGMLKEYRYGEAAAYLSDYAGRMGSAELPLCECYVVDVIARRFKAQAEAQNIRTDFQLALPEHSGISDTDLCIVLGNLLENAIHACAAQKEGEKFLRVLARTEKPDVFVSVENSCEPVVAPEYDGLGISSVQVVAKKYGGFAKFEQQGSMFHAAVLMYRETDV